VNDLAAIASQATLSGALSPESIKIDGRDKRERLAFAARYAQLILFYNQNNQVSGSWAPFLLKDRLILLATISSCDYQRYQLQFTQLIQRLVKIDDASISSNLNAVFSLFKNLFGQLNYWLKYMCADQNPYLLREFLLEKIRQTLAQGLAQAQQVQRIFRLKYPNQIDQVSEQFYQHFESPWHEARSSTNSAAVLNTETPNKDLLAILDGIFQDTFSVFLQTIDSAKQDFYRLQDQANEHPDTALLIAFSDLMKVQQEQINRYSRAHLNFYYRDILQQTPKGAVADQAFTCLALSDNTPTFTLSAGTEFKAGSYADGSDIIFTNTDEVNLNQSKIKQVQTQFYLGTVADALHISTVKSPTEIKRDTNGQVLSWNAFGSAQGEVVTQGFVIASPMLFLGSGTRRVTLKLVFSQAVRGDYFMDSEFALSSAKAWQPALVGQAHVSPATGDAQSQPAVTIKPLQDEDASTHQSLSYQLDISASAPAIEAATGIKGAPVSVWPQLKVMLGASIDLQNVPLLTEVSIDTFVQESEQLSIANDTSALSNKAPAQVFGPVPTLGDNFYIGSNECFAKPLQWLSLHQTWDGLPSKFSEYYASYNNYLDTHESETSTDYNNTVFTGAWGILNQRQWSVLAEQQQGTTGEGSLEPSQLFQQDAPTAPPEKNTPYSVFCFDFSQSNNQHLRIYPTPELSLAPLPAIELADSGYLRIQLNAPHYAFGHDLYPKVVADVSLQNAQILIKQASTGLLAQIFKSIFSTTEHALDAVKSVFVNSEEDETQKTSPLVAQPNPPYSPQQSSINLSYYANHCYTLVINTNGSSSKGEHTNSSATTEPVSLSSIDDSSPHEVESAPCNYDQNYPLELFHIGSFNNYCALKIPENTSDKTLANKTLIPKVGNTDDDNTAQGVPLFNGVSSQGCLYIELDDIDPPGPLHLFIELQQSGDSLESTGTVENKNKNQNASYFYWSKTGWKSLNVLNDETLNLTCSGILSVELEQDIDPCPLMADGGFWLALVNAQQANMTVTDVISPPAPDINSESTLSISYLNSQAVKLQRANLAPLPQGETPTLAADLISATLNKVPQISEIIQPFASFAGRPAENDDAMDNRVSQRLHNKDRSLYQNDYQVLSMQADPDLYQVVILSPQQYAPKNTLPQQRTSPTSAGLVHLGLINQYSDSQQSQAFLPQVSPCRQRHIEDYLAPRISAMANIKISNMRHQVLKVDATLQASSEINGSEWFDNINQQLRLYLSPWIQSTQAQRQLEQPLTRSDLISFLSSLEQVSAVTALSVSLFPVGTSGNDAYIDADQASAQTEEVITASAIDAILVSAEQHSLSLANTSANTSVKASNSASNNGGEQ